MSTMDHYVRNVIVPEAAPAVADSRTGRRTVLGIFAFGLLMVGMLWLYWELYTRPFRPLQKAIAAAYPGTRPSVIGGRHKSHQSGNPKTLRMVLQMPLEDFNPAKAPEESEKRALELVRLADQHVDLSTYELVEVHLVQRPPERPQQIWSKSKSVAEWKKELTAPAEETAVP